MYWQVKFWTSKSINIYTPTKDLILFEHTLYPNDVCIYAKTKNLHQMHLAVNSCKLNVTYNVPRNLLALYSMVVLYVYHNFRLHYRCSNEVQFLSHFVECFQVVLLPTNRWQKFDFLKNLSRPAFELLACVVEGWSSSIQCSLHCGTYYTVFGILR